MVTRWRSRIITVAILYFTFIGGTFLTDHRIVLRIVHHALVTLVLGGWMVVVLRRRGFPTTPLDGPLAAFFLVHVVATIFAVDPRISVEALWRIGTHILMFYLVVDLVRLYGPRIMLEPLFFASAVVILIGVVEFVSWYFGLPLLPIFKQSWPEIGGLSDPIPPDIYRLNFTLGFSTGLSAYLAMLIPVGLAWTIVTRKKDTRRGMILWMVGAFVVEGLSFSRGGLLSLAVSLPTLGALILAGNPGWRRRITHQLRDWRVITGLVATAILMLVIGLGWARQNLAGHRSGDVVRLDLWRSALRIGLEHPITGVGPFGFGRALRPVRDAAVTGDRHMTADNRLLTTWAEAGLPGVLALVWLVVTLFWVGYQRWREGDEMERVRLAGICAGLLGFTAHNLVDTFTATPIVLPSFIMASYLVAPSQKQEQAGISRFQWVVSALLLAALGLSEIGWVISDRAQVYFTQAIRFAGQGDYERALEAVGRAQKIDPAMGFYAAHRAQFLGELAAQDESYLGEAITAYEAAFGFEDTYDLMLANYGALLLQRGDLDTALEMMQQAAEINPREPRFFLWLSSVAEEAGDHALAREAYLHALEGDPPSAGSAYWDITPLRMEARAEFLEQVGVADLPLRVVTQISPECWDSFGQDKDAIEPQCAGEISLWIENEPEVALAAFTRAIDADPAQGVLYQLRAEVNLALGDLESAERDARTAIFLGNTGAYTVLGKIAELKGDIEGAIAAYVSGGPVIVQWQGWDVSVYNRRGRLRYLPQLDVLGPGRYDFASWLALAQLYETQGRAEDAQRVYDAMAAFDPYFEAEP